MKLLFIILTVLSSFLAKLEKSTFKTDYTATVEEEASSPMNYPGTITMQGRQFLLSMSGTTAAYDGKTMYMFSEETDELTLTTPTDEELVESNPLLFAKEMSESCTVTERASKDGQQTIITLIPKDQSNGINRFVLHVRNADLTPMKVEVKENKAVSRIVFNNPAFIPTPPSFVIEPDETTFVNDLRF